MPSGFLRSGTALLMLAAAPAQAALLHYTISGVGDVGQTEYASFYLDSKPIPLAQNAGPDNFRLKFVSGIFQYGATTKTVQDIVFFADSFGGGLAIVDPTVAGNDPNFFDYTLFNFGGEQFYTGPESAPTLRTGQFTLIDYNSAEPTEISLDVQAVPEPASWAMLVAGFGMIGTAMRRHRVAVRFA